MGCTVGKGVGFEEGLLAQTASHDMTNRHSERGRKGGRDRNQNQMAVIATTQVSKHTCQLVSMSVVFSSDTYVTNVINPWLLTHLVG